jgi:hypothetical protein
MMNEMKNIEFFTAPGIAGDLVKWRQLGDSKIREFSEFPENWINIMYAKLLDSPEKIKNSKVDEDSKRVVIHKIIIKYWSCYDMTKLDIDENGMFNFEKVDIKEVKILVLESMDLRIKELSEIATKAVSEKMALQMARQNINELKLF